MKHFSFNSFPEKKKKKKERKTKTREMSNFLVQYFIPPVTQRYTILKNRTKNPTLVITHFAQTSFEENNRKISEFISLDETFEKDRTKFRLIL